MLPKNTNMLANTLIRFETHIPNCDISTSKCSEFLVIQSDSKFFLFATREVGGAHQLTSIPTDIRKTLRKVWSFSMTNH